MSEWQYDEYPYIEFLDFTFGSIGQPEIQKEDGTISIPVREMHILPGFPGYSTEIIVLEGWLHLHGVIKSLRSLYLYDRAEGENTEKRVYTDGPFPHTEDELYLLSLEVATHKPIGWIGWSIVCSSVSVEIVKSKEPL